MASLPGGARWVGVAARARPATPAIAARLEGQCRSPAFAKRGFANIFAGFREAASTGSPGLEAGVSTDATITSNAKAAGIIKRARDGVRLLGGAAPKRKLIIDVAGASRPAIAAVEKAGGTVTVATPAAPAEAEAKA